MPRQTVAGRESPKQSALRGPPQAGLTRLREAIAYCEGVRDFVSRDLFSNILEGEEDQVDFIETQFELIDRIGLERYILLQSGSAD